MQLSFYPVKALFATAMLAGVFLNPPTGKFPSKKKTAPPQTISITLKLRSDVPFKVQAAPFKYDKHMAYSFTLDDGYRSAFLTAFPLLNGGKISPAFPDEWNNDEGGDGTYSNGLFYSDGCGQNIPFKLGLAINAGNLGDQPLNRGHLSWAEVSQMHDAGWDLLNHGYYHATKPGTDFLSEVTRNTAAVKEHLGITLSQFVVPGGEHEPGYELEYEKDALANGCFSVASYKGAGPIIDAGKPVNLDNMVYARTFIKSDDKVDFSAVAIQVKRIDSIMSQPQHLWYNEFTHGTGNSNLWSLSILFPEFKEYMATIAKKYGTKGTDAIWMASWQEVYEYLWLRDRTTVTCTQKGRDVVISLQLPEIPASFRYHDISLAVNTNAAFAIAATTPGITVTHDGKKGHRLLNVKIN